MTKYNRVTGKVFGGNANATGDNPEIGQFGSAKDGSYIGTSDISSIQALPAWGKGWIGAVTPETNFPPLPEMTGAMKVLSEQQCYLLQQGIPEWDNATIYYKNSFSSKNGKIYISQSDENQGNDPETDNTSWKQIYYLNNKITNCILEAPNGVLTSSGNTFTAKAGLKVLIPNGRNADGTLNNIEYTLENDVSNTASSGENNYIYSIYLDPDGENGISYAIREPDCYTLPTKQYNSSRFIYNITENKFYWTPSGTPNWSERKYAIIGTYVYSNNSVTNLKSEQPINILKQSDKSQIINWNNPDWENFINFTSLPFTAPSDGIINIAATTNQYLAIRINNIPINYTVNSYSWQNCCFFRVSKTDIITRQSGIVGPCTFIPMKGAN